MNEQNQHLNARLMEQDAVDLQALLSLWIRKLPIILLVTVIFTLAGFFGTKLRMRPMYSSDTKVYVLVKAEYQDTAYIDFSTSSLIADDFAALVVSRLIMQEVIDILGLQTSPDGLAGQVSIESEEYARVITIRVVDSDPERARQIADTVREVACVKVAEIMKMDSISTVEEANLPMPYYTMNPRRNCLLTGAAGFILMLLLFALIYWLDDTIKTEEDVEKYLGLTVLAAVPQRGAFKANRSKDRRRMKKRDVSKQDSFAQADKLIEADGQDTAEGQKSRELVKETSAPERL